MSSSPAPSDRHAHVAASPASRLAVTARWRAWGKLHGLAELLLPRWYGTGWQGRVHTWVANRRIGAWCRWEEVVHPERITEREERLRYGR